MKVHYGRMLAVAIAALASVCSAKDLYWWGNGSITWEANGAKAFREATGSETPVQFENGANAIFDSDYFAPQSVQARIGSTLTVGDLLFDLSRDFTITSTAKRVVSVATFVKKGPGTLFWKPYQADVSIGNNTVRIEEGKLVYEPGTQYFSFGTIGGGANDGTTFEIENGAEFSVRLRNSLNGNATFGP